MPLNQITCKLKMLDEAWENNDKSAYILLHTVIYWVSTTNLKCINCRNLSSIYRAYKTNTEHTIVWVQKNTKPYVYIGTRHAYYNTG